jgi:hypothetical protein
VTTASPSMIGAALEARSVVLKKPLALLRTSGS